MKNAIDGKRCKEVQNNAISRTSDPYSNTTHRRKILVKLAPG